MGAMHRGAQVPGTRLVKDHVHPRDIWDMNQGSRYKEHLTCGLPALLPHCWAVCPLSPCGRWMSSLPH